MCLGGEREGGEEGELTIGNVTVMKGAEVAIRKKAAGRIDHGFVGAATRG